MATALPLALLVAALGSPPAWGWQQTPGAARLDDLDPADPAAVATAIDLLCADAPAARCPLGQRIAAAEWLRRHPSPAAGPALLRTFARSRFGALPEDPDLFERALRAARALPPEARRAAVVDGLAPALADLTWERLMARWLQPLAQTADPAALRELRGWPTAHADEAAALRRDIADEVVAAYAVYPDTFLDALSPTGGGIAEAAARLAEDRMLAALLRSDDPEVVSVAIAVVAAGQRGGPATLLALDSAWRNEAIAPELREQARDPALRASLARDLPALAPPTTPPGQRPGLDARDPGVALTEFVEVRDGPDAPTGSGWLLAAFGLAALGGLLGTRGSHAGLRTTGALCLGLAVPACAEGSLRAAGAPSLTEQGPMFSFYHEDDALLSATDGGWVVSPGGPVRHQAVAWPKPDDTFRIGVVGASTAHGSHHLQEEAFSARLATRLEPALPGRTVEALNLAIGGARSDGVRRAAEVALDHGADALVVAMGHNEAAAFSQLGRWDPGATRGLSLQIALSRSALVGTLARLLPRVGQRPTLPGGRPDRAAQADLQQIARESLAWNLGALLDRAGEAEVPVVVVIPPTNWRFVHLDAWDTPGPGDAGDLQDRMERADRRAAAGDGPAARALVQSAVDRSAGPRELTGPLRQTLLEVAAAHGATVVRADRLFDAWAPDGLTASGLFWDDLHPSRHGHRLLGDATAVALAARLDVALPAATP